MTFSLPLIEAPPAPPPLVSLRNVSVRRGQSEVLRGLHADVIRGRITAVVGLNGSGKTTLLRTLLNEFPYTGTISFHCGHDHRKPKPEHVGYVPQRLMIDPRLPCTVRDVMGLALQRRPIFLGIRRRLSAKMEQLLEKVGAPGLLDTPIEGLSGGQLQRVLLSLALEPSPELLLLDEPAAGIDFQSLAAFYRLIRDLNETTHITVLMVSHDLGMLPGFADTVLCMKAGSVAAAGMPDEVLTPTGLAELYGPGTLRFPLGDAAPEHIHTANCAHG